MNQKGIFQVVTKSFGLYFILQAVLYSKQLITVLAGTQLFDDDRNSYYFYLGQSIFDLAVFAIMAWILIGKSDYISARLTRNTDQLDLNLSKTDFIEIVIIGVGSILLVNALPELLSKVSHYLYFNEYARGEKDLFWDEKNRKVGIMYSIFKLATGLLTVTNGRLLSRRLARIGDKDENLEVK